MRSIDSCSTVLSRLVSKKEGELTQGIMASAIGIFYLNYFQIQELSTQNSFLAIHYMHVSKKAGAPNEKILAKYLKYHFLLS